MDFSGLNMIEVLLFSVISFVSEGGSSPIETTTPSAPPDIRLITHLCPEQNSSDINLIAMTRYDDLTQRCYTVLSQGPCGKNMVFYAKDNIYGECDCSQEDRLLIYHKNSNQCYYIFQKAYCNNNQWLDVTRQGKPVCVRNSCSKIRNSRNLDLVKFNGTCVEVGKSSGCEQGEVVGFVKNKRLPVCLSSRSLPTNISRSMGVPGTPCSVGSVYAMNGICNPPFDFD